jgi:chromosome segregation ATPase
MAEEREEEPISPVIAEDQIFVEGTPAIKQQEQQLQEEKLQEQYMENKESQEKTRNGKKRQKRRRAITYLTQISRQVEKNGNQIDRITTFIQSLQKQRQSIISRGVGIKQSQSQSIKQIKSQLGHLQKQVSLIQKDIQKLRATSAGKARFRKLHSNISSPTTVKPKSQMSKKNKPIVSTRLRRKRIKKR